MRATWYGLLAVCFGALLVVGCSGGDGKHGDTVTLRVYERSPYLVPVNAGWAAFQDGDGAWRAITPSATGVYTSTVSDAQGRFGFALYADGDLHLQYGTLAEGTVLVQFLDNGLSFTRDARVSLPPGYGQMMGSISYDFTAGQSSAVTPNSMSTSTPITSYGTMLPVGLFDLAVVDDAWTSPRMASWIFLQRDLNMTATSTTYNFTVTSAGRILLMDGGTAHITGSTAGAAADLQYVTAHGTPIPIAYDDNVDDGTLAFRAVPTAAAVAGDCYQLKVTRGYGEVTGVFADPTAISLPAPDASFTSYSAQVVTVGEHGYLRFSGLSMPGALGYFLYGAAGGRFVDAIISTGWLDANDTTMVQVPDFTDVNGWQTAWSTPVTATVTDLDADAFAGNVPFVQAVGRYFSRSTFPLVDGQWSGTFPWID